MIRSTMSPAKVAAIARKDVGQVLRHAEEKHAELVNKCPSPNSKELLTRSGYFTSSKGLQWIYVITVTQGRVTTYPLLWYPTSKGVCAMQVDAEGPASFFQAHVMDRYLERYMKQGDVMNALREFHLHNYAKVFLPDTYKDEAQAFVAASDEGYVVGEFRQDDALLFFRTFYDQAAGRTRFGALRASLNWQVAWHKVQFAHVGRRDTPHIAWGRGYKRRLAA